jgi:hypothetical protein
MNKWWNNLTDIDQINIIGIIGVAFMITGIWWAPLVRQYFGLV